jgi:hypothetical protein
MFLIAMTSFQLKMYAPLYFHELVRFAQSIVHVLFNIERSFIIHLFVSVLFWLLDSSVISSRFSHVSFKASMLSKLAINNKLSSKICSQMLVHDNRFDVSILSFDISVFIIVSVLLTTDSVKTIVLSQVVFIAFT